MKLYTYLNYGGNCRQAFEFYVDHLGGKITMITTHGEQPEADRVPPEWKNAVRVDTLGTTGRSRRSSASPCSLSHMRACLIRIARFARL